MLLQLFVHFKWCFQNLVGVHVVCRSRLQGKGSFNGIDMCAHAVREAKAEGISIELTCVL